MPEDRDAKAGKSGAAKRVERLEAQLRANLKRRKDQSRARARPDTEAGLLSPDEAPPTPDGERSRPGRE